MACQVIRKDGKVVEVLTDKGQPSALFEEIKSTVGVETTALKIWAATTTPTFKSLYVGDYSDLGEPILTRVSEDTFSFKGKDEDIITIKSAITPYNETRNIELITEGINTNAALFNNEPLTPIQEKIYADSENKKTFNKMSQRHMAAYNMINKNRKQYNQLERKVIDGETRTVSASGRVYRGTGFNDDGLAQFLKEGFKTSEWDKNLSWTENKANQYWKDKSETDVIYIDNKFYTKKSFIEDKLPNELMGKINGNIKHLYDQWIHATTYERKAIKSDIDKEIAKAKEINPKISDKYLSWMEQLEPVVLARLGINQETVVLHEVPFVSDDLGITGRIDKLIVYPDGYMTIREIKTSQHIRSSSYTQLFKYGYKEYLESNKLNEAKVQLLLYAFALSLDNPEAKFTNLGIDLYTDATTSLTDASAISLSREDVDRILSMLKYMFQEESKDPTSPIKDIWEKIKDKKHAFDINTYSNTPSVTTTKKPSKAGKVESIAVAGQNTLESAMSLVDNLRMDLGIYYNIEEYKNQAFTYKKQVIEKKFNDINNNITHFVSIMSGGGISNDLWLKDISYLNFAIGGNTSNVRHPLAAVYNEYFHQQYYKSIKDYNNDIDEMYQYFLPVLNKWLVSNGQKPYTRLDEKIFGVLTKQDFMGKKITEVWDQFWTTSLIEGSVITHRKSAADWKANEKEEKAFSEFLDRYYEKWLGKEDSFVNKKATYRLDRDLTSLKTISHLDVYNGLGEGGKPERNPFNYSAFTKRKDVDGNEKFIAYTPSVPMLPHEKERSLEKANIGISRFKKFFLNYFTSFLDDNIQDKASDNTLMVPMRYLGKMGDDFANNSKDLAWSFALFSKNMNNKVHMDDVIAIGEAMAVHLEQVNDPRDEQDRVKHLVKLIRTMSKYQGKGEMPKDDFVANVRRTTESLFRIPINVKVNKNGYTRDVEYVITLHTLLRGLRNAATFSIMTLAPVGAAYNFFQALTSSIKTGLKGRAGQYFIKGADKEAFDFNETDYLAGIKEWKQMQESAIGDDLKKNKLFLLARDFAYLPKNVEYFSIEGDNLTSPLKALQPQSLLFMHTMAEEMNTYAILYAQLKSMKVKDKNGNMISMYDAYKVVPETVNGITKYEVMWDTEKVGMRFKEKIGDTEIPVYGLTTKEVIKLKRVYERMQGNYRKEEKSYIELYALGQVFMQFKRFLPTIIRNQFQGRRKDTSLGYYIINEDATGDQIGEWKSKMVAGKYYVLFNYFVGGVLSPLMKKMPKSFTDKASFEFRGDYRWSEMEVEEQMEVIDALLTLGIMIGLTAFAWKKAKDDGEKDSLAVIFNKLGETISQPWSVVQTVVALKNSALGGTVGNLMFNQVSGLSEMFGAEIKYLTGINDSPYNEKGDLPGFKKFWGNLPLGRSIRDLKNMKENWNKNGGD